MKIVKTNIASYTNTSLSVFSREESFFQSPFHSHPEFELVYILESHGKRIIGNSVESFESGDMVFLGDDIPHVWLNDEIFYKGINSLKAKAMVIYFSRDLFGNSFYELPEAQEVKKFLSQGVKGVSITGQTNAVIAKKMEKLLKKKGFEVVMGLIEILFLLSKSKDLRYINDDSYVSVSDENKNDRLAAVFQYVKTNYKEEISLDEISKIANLTPTSFCRMFKSKTKKAFVEYLNEIRVSNACKYLIETDLGISEIAYECGYKTASNFNKLFKKLIGTTPKEYRRNALVQAF
ncbi:AraC family transcriptional regulator [Flavobacterium sp. LC2016-12]|uniref:AraC family transcriptional regulator n=1 Tax=Flavobacterium sp. LC2016-12 TaxID=2783794 RepID=UPI00188DA405|nr:AraC family transcriptional regulator [Flavobacterium sp. LC2016-12]MBF4465073.1 AraC family transcriptional regulator [Flavobacterium sp. LC2016-12]